MSSKIDIKAARKFQQEKLKKHEEELDKKFQQASKDFNAICEMIIRDFHPESIYQWGSLLERNKFSAISDIDIAVCGITDAREYFQLLKKAEELTDFPIDIVQMEKIHPLHKEMILKKGIQIYRK
jgi:predicted nucleotidyltransferase